MTSYTSNRAMCSIPYASHPSEHTPFFLPPSFHEEQPNPFAQLKRISCDSKLNLLLVFFPFGVWAWLAGWNDVLVFLLNFFAIMPLSKLLCFSTEEVALRLGSTVGSLMNATFGNATELILAIVALRKGHFYVAQASLLGSILSNLLLVLGSSFLLGGLAYPEQSFSSTLTNTTNGMLLLFSLALILPSVIHSTVTDEIVRDVLMLKLSRGMAVVLLILYVVYLIFQLRTHSHLFEDEASVEETPELSLPVSIVLLVVTTLLISLSAEFLVDSLDGMISTSGLTESFISIILLPVISNAVEHVSSLRFAVKNKMNLCIGITLGSANQISLFVIPLLVLMGWILNQPVTFFFGYLETAILLISVMTVYCITSGGKCHWLEGYICLAAYALTAICFGVVPKI
ncbi:uncharacterized protein VTP21DRAFT_6724 [Calcarisporiella thermophila]|uniref:uncharacterized protein n=1 Tax=Calcarisporiella thermophila TaxID=911321 RepID=UPI003743B4E5